MIIPKTITIGGKEYRINVTYWHQRIFLEEWQPKLNASNDEKGVIVSHDCTLDLIMKIIVDEPAPFESAEEIMKVISPVEFKEIDANLYGWIFGKDKGAEEEPGKQ